MNLYNVMVTYTGEGETNIYIPGVGDTRITNGRPIYLKGAGFNVIEALRQFRVMQIDLKIGVGQKGAFRIIDLEEITSPIRKPISNVKKEKEPLSNADLDSIFKAGTNGPIPVETKEVEEVKVDYSEYKLPSGQYEGKTLAEVDKEGKLKSVYNGFKSRNPEVKEAIEKYYEAQVK